ncbi:MAG TPA: drug/metabolite exporter YedA [Kouleothrix sp.]|uniref:drug/metabolite exporter YedA n=1 Tax=Kouleothrix sp. TaxID=2779161 RepID=UPI002CAB2FEE|nr:drug/metabolite exporter YedA [Kouleothrix sp.]
MLFARRQAAAERGHRLGIALALLAVYIIWGSTYLAIRYTLSSFPPFLMAGMRFTLAGALLLGLARWRGAALPSRKQWRNAALIGGLLLVSGNGVVVFAEQWVTSTMTALMLATVPIWTALIAGVWGRWPGRAEWAGLVLGFLGIVLLNMEGNLRANPLGAALMLAAAISWSLGSALSRRLELPAGLMGSGAEMLCAGLMLALLSLGRGEHMAAAPNAAALAAFIYLIIFGALVAFSAYGFLLAHARPALATSYAYVNPVVAVALGVGLAGEHIGPTGLAAMLIILAAVGLVMLARR